MSSSETAHSTAGGLKPLTTLLVTLTECRPTAMSNQRRSIAWAMPAASAWTAPRLRAIGGGASSRIAATKNGNASSLW
jgi:hypothetical protein